MSDENGLEGIRCPACTNEARFTITCTTYAVATKGGVEPWGGLRWDDASEITCPECENIGQLYEFRAHPDLPLDPDGMNDRRAVSASCAIAAFRDEAGTDLDDALCDLLAALMHWADRNRFDFASALDRSRVRYAAETSACQDTDSVPCF